MEVGQGPNWGCSAKEKNPFVGYFITPSLSRILASDGKIIDE
jgi:hypothetical protein